MSTAQTGRTHDLHPTASRKPKEPLDPWAPSTHDPKKTFPGRAFDIVRYWIQAAVMSLKDKFNQGVTFHQQGRLAEAERIFLDIVQRRPNHFDALYLLGMIALQTRRTQHGIELIRKAISLNGSFPEAHNNLGYALFYLQRPEDALTSFNRAIALKQDYAEAHNNRGHALLALKRHDEALASCNRAIELKPNYFEAYRYRGIALQELKRSEEALASFDRAIALKPDYAEAYYNRGNALQDLQRPEEALVSYDRAIALKPDDALAYYNRGTVLGYINRPKDALASYAKAISLKPGYAEAHLNQSHCLLLLGCFEDGWLKYEWRKRGNKPVAARNFPQPLWLGAEDIAGKTLFLWWEQGFGDTIQFCRYAKLAEARGAKVFLSVQQPLCELLKRISPTIQIVGQDEVPPHFDYHCPLLSLPLAFGTTLATIPAQQQYLKPDDELRVAWAARLPPKTKPRIGLVWSGRTDHLPYRSIDLNQLQPILSRELVWICLQKEVREADLAILRQHGGIAFFRDELRDFNDTAALLDLMDLVIAVDTGVAHLAGAMGKPVWILLSYNSDWRWLLDRDDSPWYPTARLYRQEKAGDWGPVVQHVKSDLIDLFTNQTLRTS